ncbi:MAG: methyltransferase [Planctomycetota bacterium]
MTETIECVGPNGNLLRFENFGGVYPVNRYQSLWLATTACYEAFALSSAVGKRLQDMSLWEVCAGGGPCAVLMKSAGMGFVRATDVSPAALEACRRNAQLNQQELSEVFHADMLDTADDHRTFDLIVCNPPCRPTEMCDTSLDSPIGRAINGGPGGTLYYQRLIRGASKKLNSDGRLVFVVVSTIDLTEIKEELNACFPDRWRVSMNSPVAQPFRIENSDAIRTLNDRCQDRQSIIWRDRNNQYWRFSWVIVADMQPLPVRNTGSLFLRNHTWELNERDFPGINESLVHGSLNDRDEF